MSKIDWLNFNWIDYAILVVILFSLLIGIVRGFICEAISLLTWVVAFLLAFKFAHSLGEHFTWFESTTARYLLAFFFIFMIILIIGITINVLIRTMIWQQTGIPAFDRLLGMLFGFVRGVLVIALILLFVQSSVLKSEPTVQESQLSPVFNPIVDWLRRILPKDVVDITNWLNTNEPVPNDNKSNSP